MILRSSMPNGLPPPGSLDAELTAPASKSVTHRALVAAALADGDSTLLGPLVSDDTLVTRRGLAALGIELEDLGERCRVRGCGGRVPGGGEIPLEHSGTSYRFLLAVAALADDRSHLDGSARLRRRPARELIESLRGLGASIEAAPGAEGIPLRTGGRRPAGGRVRIEAGRSSQFASALLLIGPHLAAGIDLTLAPPAVSLPYIQLTADVLGRFGVAVERPDRLRWRVPPGRYPGREYRVEGDHSSASYPLAAALIVGGRVRVNGLDPDSAQPDRRMDTILEELGAKVERGPDWVEARGSGSIRGFDLELSDAPDLVPTLAAIALFAGGPCVMRGIAHLRHKESDRLELLAENLRALGRQARAGEDRLEVGPQSAGPRGGMVRTDSDHRIAMAFAVAGLRHEGIRLDDESCVAKSDPGFWARLRALCERR